MNPWLKVHAAHHLPDWDAPTDTCECGQREAVDELKSLYRRVRQYKARLDLTLYVLEMHPGAGPHWPGCEDNLLHWECRLKANIQSLLYPTAKV